MLAIGHWLIAQLVPKEVQLCVCRGFLLRQPVSKRKGGLVNRGDILSVPSCESAKEAVDDAGCPPVYAIFQLEKYSSLGLVADLACGNAGVCEDHVLGAFYDRVQAPDLRLCWLAVGNVHDLHVCSE